MSWTSSDLYQKTFKPRQQLRGISSKATVFRGLRVPLTRRWTLAKRSDQLISYSISNKKQQSTCSDYLSSSSRIGLVGSHRCDICPRHSFFSEHSIRKHFSQATNQRQILKLPELSLNLLWQLCLQPTHYSESYLSASLSIQIGG